MSLLSNLVAYIGSLRGPWLLGGDWNMDPATLASSGWLALVEGVVVAPALPTCNGNTYDFFVVSRGLVPAIVGVQRIDDAGLLPHWPVRLVLRGDARRFAIRQLVRPKLVEPILPFGPLPEQICQLPVIGESVEELDRSAIAWHAAARGGGVAISVRRFG